MRKFVKSLIVLCPLLFFIVAVNYLVDPVSMFRFKDAEKKIAEYLLQGKNVANFSNYHERLIQRYYVARISRRLEVAVLGSSRSMLIGKSLFPEKNFFNSSVDGATLEDLMATYWMYRDRKLLPQRMIIGLDPWILNGKNGLRNYLTIYAEYRKIRDHLRGNGPDFNGLTDVSAKLAYFYNLISPSYFQLALGKFLKARITDTVDRKCYMTVNSIEDEAMVKLSDGTESFSAKERNLSVDSVRRRAISYASQVRVYGLADFAKIGQEQLGLLKKFVALVKRDGVEPVFFLCPYHPSAYSVFMDSGKYAIIKDVERCFRDLASQEAIEVIGSYDPGACGLTEFDFYDGMHPKEEAIVIIFNRHGK